MRARLAAVLFAVTACTNPTSPVATPSPSSPPVVTTTAPAPATTSPTAAVPAGRLGAWQPCDNGFECATFTVPLDYARPAAGTMHLAVTRRRATGRRIGVLVTGAGGPGGSGVALAQRDSIAYPAGFDIVGMDVRGTGGSDHVDCVGDGPLARMADADQSPDTAAEVSALLAAHREIARGCGARAARLLPHLATVDAARDLDALRAALGEDRISYIGYSYGTVLGQRYAEQFPSHVRAMVLDGAADQSRTPAQFQLDQALSFEDLLGRFLAQHPSLRKGLDPLIARAERSPLVVGSRRLNQTGVQLGIAAALYSDRRWPDLAGALREAYGGNGLDLLTLYDGLMDRDASGHFTDKWEAYASIRCVDGTQSRDPGSYARDSAAFGRRSPHFGAAFAYELLLCAYWPVPPVSGAAPVALHLATPPLVVATTHDPATPIQWGTAVARQSGGRLLTYEGNRHTIALYGISPCVDGAVTAYLTRLAVPVAGTRCA